MFLSETLRDGSSLIFDAYAALTEDIISGLFIDLEIKKKKTLKN